MKPSRWVNSNLLGQRTQCLKDTSSLSYKIKTQSSHSLLTTRPDRQPSYLPQSKVNNASIFNYFWQHPILTVLLMQPACNCDWQGMHTNWNPSTTSYDYTITSFNSSFSCRFSIHIRRFTATNEVVTQRVKDQTLSWILRHCLRMTLWNLLASSRLATTRSKSAANSSTER